MTLIFKLSSFFIDLFLHIWLADGLVQGNDADHNSILIFLNFGNSPVVEICPHKTLLEIRGGQRS